MLGKTLVTGLLATSLVVGLVSIVIVARPAAAQDDLPDGPGKTILMKSCNTGCHDYTQVTGEHLTADQWNSTVTNMMNFGATVPDDQMSTLVAYLATNFGVGGQPAATPSTPAPVQPSDAPVAASTAPTQTPAAQ